VPRDRGLRLYPKSTCTTQSLDHLDVRNFASTRRKIFRFCPLATPRDISINFLNLVDVSQGDVVSLRDLTRGARSVTLSPSALADVVFETW
jgi:hypothetical protein